MLGSDEGEKEKFRDFLREAMLHQPRKHLSCNNSWAVDAGFVSTFSRYKSPSPAFFHQENKSSLVKSKMILSKLLFLTALSGLAAAIPVNMSQVTAEATKNLPADAIAKTLSADDYFFPSDYKRVLKTAEKMRHAKISGPNYKTRYREVGYVYDFEEQGVNVTSDKVCETMSNSFMPYTGFRFMTSVILTARAVVYRRYSVLVYCHEGRVATKALKGIPQYENDILWGTEYCFPKEPILQNVPTPEGCIVPARSSRAWNIEAGLLWTWNKPERSYGGLFRYPGRLFKDQYDQHHLNNDVFVPVLPLITDEPYLGSVGVDTLGYMSVNIPLAYTPDYYSYAYPRDSDVWAAFLDVNENYLLMMPSISLPFTHRIKTGLADSIVSVFRKLLSWPKPGDKPAVASAMDYDDEEESGDVSMAEYDTTELVKRFGPEGVSIPGIMKEFAEAIATLAFDRALNRAKTRLALLENKHLAKYVYMEISRLLKRAQTQTMEWNPFREDSQK